MEQRRFASPRHATRGAGSEITYFRTAIIGHNCITSEDPIGIETGAMIAAVKNSDFRRRLIRRGAMRGILCLLSCLVATLPASGPAAANESTTHPASRVTVRILYRFKGGADGAHPQGGVVMDSTGNLYGTTSGTMIGGVHGCSHCGTVFKISRRTHAESILHTFVGGITDGADPTAGLTIDRAGNLYGTTEFGGGGCTTNYLVGCGTVFEISPRNHSETVVWSFSAQGGWAPDGGPMMSRAGDLYGTTTSGSCGNGTYGCGTVFEIAAGTREKTVLHTFARGGDIDGFPKGGLVMDRSGDLYGTTWTSNLQNHLTGMVFEILARTHEAKRLHTFLGGRDGATPNGSLVIDGKGDLYGTTRWGGGFCDSGSGPGVDASGCGTVFEISARTRKETILYRLEGGRDGMDPRDGLVMDSAGNLYGTTYGGGVGCRFGCGTVFEIAAGSHEETVLYRFRGGRGGNGPEGRLFMDGAGDIFGTTFGGGESCRKRMEFGPGCGTVFEIIRN